MVGRTSSPSNRRASWHWLGRAFVGIVVLSSVVGACGGTSPPRRWPVNEDRASYRGLRLGMSMAQARKVSGGAAVSVSGNWAPLSASGRSISFPVAAYRSWHEFKARDVGLASANGRLVGILAIKSGTYTKAGGVVIGDSLQAVMRAYRGARCSIAEYAESSLRYPYCVGRLRPGRYLWFGGDPIDTIAIAAAPLGAMRGQDRGPLLRLR